MPLLDALDKAFGWAVAALLGGCVYTIRRIFTNEQQIALLKKDLDARDIQRTEQNLMFTTALDSIREDVGEIKEEVRYLRRTKDAN